MTEKEAMLKRVDWAIQEAEDNISFAEAKGVKATAHEKALYKEAFVRGWSTCFGFLKLHGDITVKS